MNLVNYFCLGAQRKGLGRAASNTIVPSRKKKKERDDKKVPGGIWLRLMFEPASGFRSRGFRMLDRVFSRAETGGECRLGSWVGLTLH